MCVCDGGRGKADPLATDVQCHDWRGLPSWLATKEKVECRGAHCWIVLLRQQRTYKGEPAYQAQQHRHPAHLPSPEGASVRVHSAAGTAGARAKRINSRHWPSTGKAFRPSSFSSGCQKLFQKNLFLRIFPVCLVFYQGVRGHHVAFTTRRNRGCVATHSPLNLWYPSNRAVEEVCINQPVRNTSFPDHAHASIPSQLDQGGIVRARL